MRFKNAWIAAPIFLVLFIISLSPWLVGYQYKQRYISLIAKLNKLYDPRIHIQLRSYQQGWLHATAQLETIVYDHLHHPLAVMIAEEHIAHGPLIYDPFKKRLAFALAATKSDTSITQERPNSPLPTISTSANNVMYFDNTVESAFKIVKINSPTVQWDGLTGTATIKLKQDHIDHSAIALQSGNLTISIPTTQNMPSTINIAPANIKCLSNSTDNIPTHQCITNLPLITLLFQNNANVSVNALQIKQQSSVKNDYYSSASRLTINKITAPQFIIPMISAFNLELTLNNINAAILKANAHSTTPQNRLELNSKMIDPATTYAALLSFASTDGNFNLRVDSHWKSRAAQAIIQTQELPHYLYAEADLQISIPLAKKLAELVVPYIPNYIATLKQKAAATTITHLSQTAAKDQFDKAVALLVQKNQLDLPSAIAIMNTHENQPSEEALQTAINALPTTAQAKQSLITASEESKKMLNAVHQQTEQMSNEEMASLLINDWLQRNYLVQKDNDYIAKAIFDAGNPQLNGQPWHMQ